MDTGRAGAIGNLIRDLQLGKPQLKARSLLLGTVIRETMRTMPAPDFSNLNGGTLTRSGSRGKLSPSGAVANFGWDAGALYNKMLFIGGVRGANNSVGIFVGKTLPATTIPKDAYIHLIESNNSRMGLYKTNGTPTASNIATDGTFYPRDYIMPTVQLALFVDGTANRVAGFVRTGNEDFMPVYDVTDTLNTQFRYFGFFFDNVVGSAFSALVPMACYVEN